MVEFDAKVIRGFAGSLYSQAAWIVGIYAAVGATVGLIAGSIAYSDIKLLSALLGGGVGLFVGQSKVAILKLQAQLALCMVKIEENSRAHNLSLSEPVKNANPDSIIEHAQSWASAQPKSSENVDSEIPSVPPALKPCPHCSKEIIANATRCQHCWKSVSSAA